MKPIDKEVVDAAFRKMSIDDAVDLLIGYSISEIEKGIEHIIIMDKVGMMFSHFEPYSEIDYLEHLNDMRESNVKMVYPADA